MDKKLASLAGAVSALVPLAAVTMPATAAPNDSLTAYSYADLLKPIPNAVETLKASDAVMREDTAKVEMAEYYEHHHHHHRYRYRFYRPYYHHHHFYHHHHRYFYHHHHHHHHHHDYY